MIYTTKRMISIFLIFSSMLIVQTTLYAKSDTNETNISKIKNVLEGFEGLDTNASLSKTLIGRVEKVRINPSNLVFKARIDTGATTSSLGVNELQIITEDGHDWAEFKLEDKKLKFKVEKYIYIKQHGSKSKKRPVIKLRLTLGNISEIVKVTLADRSNYKYPLLIGRNYLYDRFIVDVSLKYTSEPSEYKEQ